jgi:hypothetical protein
MNSPPEDQSSAAAAINTAPVRREAGANTGTDMGGAS